MYRAGDHALPCGADGDGSYHHNRQKVKKKDPGKDGEEILIYEIHVKGEKMKAMKKDIWVFAAAVLMIFLLSACACGKENAFLL